MQNMSVSIITKKDVHNAIPASHFIVSTSYLNLYSTRIQKKHMENATPMTKQTQLTETYPST